MNLILRSTTKNLIRNLTKSRCKLTFVNSTNFLYADYPPHTVVGLPALSPTMEEGTVQGWTVEVGGEIEASDIVCQIETDKAAVDFEATDDGFMALHLVEPGHAPIPVGTSVSGSIISGRNHAISITAINTGKSFSILNS